LQIVMLAAITLMLAVAAIFAGADRFFTLMLALAAALTICPPWRQPE
jgi:hypothetical protein